VQTKAASLNWQDNPMLKDLSASDLANIDIEFSRDYWRKAFLYDTPFFL